MSDNNSITIEFDYWKRTFTDLGLNVRLGTINQYCSNDKPLVFNKFRVAGLKYKWPRSFESDYRQFLIDVFNERITPISNFASMVFAEDKGILEIFTNPKFRFFLKEFLSENEISRIQSIVPETVRLTNECQLDLHTRKTLNSCRSKKDEYVIKPANDGRGFGVFLGRELTQPKWETLLNEALNKFPGHFILQEFVNTRSEELVCLMRDNTFEKKTLFTNVSQFRFGQEKGDLIARSSVHRISNIAQVGVPRAIFVLEG